MTYEEIEDFLTETEKQGSKPGTERIRQLMHALGDVQEQLMIIHIAGTNGKGSVGAYIESIFTEAGYIVGRFCSPAVFSPFDMWRCYGECISRDEYTGVMSQVKKACDIVVSEGGEMPTLFEIQTAAAFVWFAGLMPDVVLLEVGLGGEDDATNLITKPMCSVITSISLDHTELLGDSIEDIAWSKAGIIKTGRPVFCAPQDPKAEKVLRTVAEERWAPVSIIKSNTLKLISLQPGRMEFYYKDVIVTTGMSQVCQMQNAALAIRTTYYMMPVLEKYAELKRSGVSRADMIERLEYQTDRSSEFGELSTINSKTIWQFMKVTSMSSFQKMHNMALIINAIKKTVWPGRFQVFGKKAPFFILDGAHNPAAVKQLAETLSKCFPDEKLTLIMGALADKDYSRMLKIMAPYAFKIYCITPDNPRALSAELLAEEALSDYSHVVCCGSLSEAAWSARDGVHTVLAFGSLSYLGELRRIIG